MLGEVPCAFWMKDFVQISSEALSQWSVSPVGTLEVEAVMTYRSWDHAMSQPMTSNDIEKGPKRVILLIIICQLSHPSPSRDGFLRGNSNPRVATSLQCASFSLCLVACARNKRWGYPSVRNECLTRWVVFKFQSYKTGTIVLLHHRVKASPVLTVILRRKSEPAGSSMKSPGLPATFHSNRYHCPADPQLWVGEQKEGSKTQLSRCVLALSVAGWTPPGHYICSSPAGRVATHRAKWAR